MLKISGEQISKFLLNFIFTNLSISHTCQIYSHTPLWPATEHLIWEEEGSTQFITQAQAQHLREICNILTKFLTYWTFKKDKKPTEQYKRI